jgi:type I restriction enzyme, R subunit
VSAQAKASSYDNFRLAFDRVFRDTVVRRMDDNEAIFKRILDDQEFQSVLMDFYARRVFDRARES